jgi:hypothetical protein
MAKASSLLDRTRPVSESPADFICMRVFSAGEGLFAGAARYRVRQSVKKRR